MSAPRKCSWRECGVIYTPKRKDGRYHSRTCQGKAHNESRRKARMRMQVGRHRIPADYGPPIVASSSPQCCGRALRACDFDFDRLGRTMVNCSLCGPHLLTLHGVRAYPQGTEQHQVLQAQVRLAQSIPDPVVSARNRGSAQRSSPFGVIGRLLGRRLRDEDGGAFAIPAQHASLESTPVDP